MSLPEMTAPEPQERWHKGRTLGGSFSGAIIDANGRLIAGYVTEADADRIIADHERAGQDDGYWLGEAHLYAEERNRLAGQVEALRELIRDRLSLSSGAMTFYEWQDRARAHLDATAKGAE